MLEVDSPESTWPTSLGNKLPILPHADKVNTNVTNTTILIRFFMRPQKLYLIGLFYTKALSCCINKSLGILNAPKLSKCLFSIWQSINLYCLC